MDKSISKLATAVLLVSGRLSPGAAAAREFAKIKAMFPGIKGVVVDNCFRPDPPYGDAKMSILYDPASHDEGDYVAGLPFVSAAPAGWTPSDKLAAGTYLAITPENLDTETSEESSTHDEDDIKSVLEELFGSPVDD